jgi:RPA family protein
MVNRPARCNRILIRLESEAARAGLDPALGLRIVRVDPAGPVVEEGYSNSYRGDDESILFGVGNDPRIAAVAKLGEYKILWDESDY